LLLIWPILIWWIITSIRIGHINNNRYLAIFWSDDPINGTWQAHPINNSFRYLDIAHGTGRNGGPVVHFSGRLFRTIQVNQRYYGEKATLMEITELTVETFHEEPVMIDHPVSFLTRHTATHHVCQLDGMMVFDRHERAPFARWMPWVAPVRKYSLTGCQNDEVELLRGFGNRTA
jgi:hypothetical protein